MKSAGSARRGRGRRWRRRIMLGCGGSLLAICVLLGLLLWLLARTVPTDYALTADPLPSPPAGKTNGPVLDGFDSPYLGHTGSWDGKGGAMFGASKIPDLDVERAMGLRWTFMSVHWRALEPNGPANPKTELPPAWHELDDFVIAAHERKLNIFMQAPVVGGNAGGPPAWAGRREPGKSAPLKMEAAAAFAGKLAARYRPGGTLARREGWSERYGVRAWELDNEPDGYRTHWKGQAGDYAEFVTKVAAAIKAEDPHALIVAPAIMSGGAAWLEAALDAQALRGSPVYRRRAKPFSLGPATDVVSFHLYEGLDTFFASEDRTIGVVLDEVRGTFEKWERRATGFEYARKTDYWHTEGNYDFLGVMSRQRRAAWRWQFFARAFACGLRKVAVMDASPAERTAVRTWIRLLPDPFPLQPAKDEIKVLHGTATVFRHRDDPGEKNPGQIWIAWARAGGGPAVIEVPTRASRVTLWQVNGTQRNLIPLGGRVQLLLEADTKMPPPVILVDR